MESIALIAHDGRKTVMLDWAERHVEDLRKFELLTTGTTGRLLEERLGLQAHKFQSGPLGGDQQVGASIVEGKVDGIIFFWDPLSSMPHDPDIKALLRLATLYNVPMACNESSADFIISSRLWRSPYKRNLELIEHNKSQRHSYKHNYEQTVVTCSVCSISMSVEEQSLDKIAVAHHHSHQDD